MKRTVLFCVYLLAVSISCAQAPQGTKERIKVYSQAIEGNLVQDPAERDVTVYLPPSYQSEPERRYPVLYMLHGFTDSDSQWFGWEDHWINLHEVLDAALAEEKTREMIVVMPNAYNRFRGSMYSSSPTIGDWETFVAKELVNYIDEHYRTLPNTASRGLAGHSMGGYGTIRLGMKYPEVWSAIYLLSPCCMEGATPNTNTEFMQSVEAVTAVDQLESVGFGVIATLASAAAWAPNPGKPPFYLDLPFAEGEVRPEIAAKFSANRTLYTIDQYIHNLKRLKAIGMDAGLQDRGISGATKKLHELLEAYDIPHFYESYEGDHLNRIAERIRTKTLPFFTEHLKFE
ncbi:alpha/beta hydrolase [Flavilitoribacter nigricans]|uniref:Esterase n=1 Tax=Flavilitoribacter nigricans (strain ATCC 23147 / DSM 23189 / NBRC 102662 / NCIMB 1420 / SS-2) TaxID=1122177 RepID=A0A2D0N2G8_FLAN2|nr:alpha/beta hydrolase-fold protein [Flavilitoribacter nigricans]PHN02588.1 esterase [Flavilitoribacter nigricans DSM 23189 = NBRC 102662]